MTQGISEIIGTADLDEGGSTQLYRALRLLLCATCGALISEGTLFTRREVAGMGLRLMPQCVECRPFRQQSKKKERSALLESLLAEQPADRRKTGGSARQISSPAGEQDEEQQQQLAEKVRRRLGPALKRGQRSRGK